MSWFKQNKCNNMHGAKVKKKNFVLVCVHLKKYTFSPGTFITFSVLKQSPSSIKI